MKNFIFKELDFLVISLVVLAVSYLIFSTLFTMTLNGVLS